MRPQVPVCDRQGLFQGSVLFINGVAILNNDRFLEKSEGFNLLSHSHSPVHRGRRATRCVQLDGVTLKLSVTTLEHTQML